MALTFTACAAAGRAAKGSAASTSRRVRRSIVRIYGLVRADARALRSHVRQRRRARSRGATARPTRFSGCRAECGFGLRARSPLRRGRLRRILHAGGDASKRAGKARQASFPRLEGRTTMRRAIPFAACAAALSLGAIEAQAQSGSVEKAVGGYSFEEAAAEAPGTKDFHSADGQADLRHRHPYRRQRLLRPGLCRGEGRRRPDRRQHPAARLRIADRRPGPRDRDPEPDRPGSDASTA